MNFACMFGGDENIYLYESREQALFDEAKQPENCCIVASAEVNAAKHYHGKIPNSGVKFIPEDISYREMLGELM